MKTNSEEISFRRKVETLWQVGLYHPLFTIAIICLSIFAALMEGVGLSFLVPIIEIAQGNATSGDMSGVGETFLQIYNLLNIPFTLEFVILGVGVVMIIRYTSSFFVGWLQYKLRVDYQRHLQIEAFEHALGARVAYYDENGSDEVLNAIVTQSRQAAQVIGLIVRLTQQIALSIVYLGIALYIAPQITLLTAVLLGVIVLVMRLRVESGYAVGDRIAEANERLQESAQAGTQGIRDIKLFQLSEEIFADFRIALDQFSISTIKKKRNQVAMDNLYQLLTALTVFGLIYVALAVISLSFAKLSIFLFSIFRLAPRVSSLNSISYNLAGTLPHLVRTHEFIDELVAYEEPDTGDESPPRDVSEVAFENVSFAYQDEEVLKDVSFEVETGEFIVFVGGSGAGKSTIVSLLTKLYLPDSGQITANGTPIKRFELGEWREKVSMVQQKPFIFNKTLRYNVTIGNRIATEDEIWQACELAEVTEFIDELPNGLDTVLGDDGVRLSGGQRQRIAVARALLKDADILVLDEATSDLDTSLEQNIQENLETAESNQILIVIAHRLSTVVNADRIYAMENGRIMEMGSHSELVEQKGLYADLYGSQ